MVGNFTINYQNFPCIIQTHFGLEKDLDNPT